MLLNIYLKKGSNHQSFSRAFITLFNENDTNLEQTVKCFQLVKA